VIAMAQPPKHSAPQFRQEELALSTVLSHKLFPGRSSLYVAEVANALEIDEKHVVDLINEGLIDAVEVTGKGNKSSRQHWRIPVSAYDDYVRRRWNNKPEAAR
jgi:hypothetical protein